MQITKGKFQKWYYIAVDDEEGEEESKEQWKRQVGFSAVFDDNVFHLEDILLFGVTKKVAFLGVTIQCCNYLGYFISVLKLLMLSF